MSQKIDCDLNICSCFHNFYPSFHVDTKLVSPENDHFNLNFNISTSIVGLSQMIILRNYNK